MLSIYTDGSVANVPDLQNSGGWAVLFCGSDGMQYWAAGHYQSSSSAQMEMIAALRALETIEKLPDYMRFDHNIKIYCDSLYVIDSANDKIKPRSNLELVEKIKNLSRRYKIDWRWVKSHSGHVYNDKVDRLAKTFAKRRYASEIFGKVYDDVWNALYIGHGERKNIRKLISVLNQRKAILEKQNPSC